MAHISFRDIKKSFGEVDVIHGISFDIHDGEFVVLVGPSGCGKSTLLRMLAGLEGITAGEIGIDDRVINDLDSKDRDIAMVFQSYALYPHMTVYDNMAFSLKLRKAPEA
ncbi:MAG: ATP-binding cassette domain-containing protein, partial [Betaproteobacteria bacterium]|nr:ATP-binding cassette domain-containing protein [Betaproteobacteria bacterium]